MTRVRTDRHPRYLPSPPFQENSVLHAYAGLICLYLAQPHRPPNVSNEGRSLRDAQQYFDRAKYLDQDNIVATIWSNAVRSAIGLIPKTQPNLIAKIPQLSKAAENRDTPASDDEDMTFNDTSIQRLKRART